jgi:cysteine synthase A
MPIYDNIITKTGRTPLIRLNRIAAGLPAAIALKAEFKTAIPAAHQQTTAEEIRN